MNMLTRVYIGRSLVLSGEGYEEAKRLAFAFRQEDEVERYIYEQVLQRREAQHAWIKRHYPEFDKLDKQQQINILRESRKNS